MSLRPDDSIVILTGAGISKESGLETFRDPDGIWARVRLEDVATPEGFMRDPGQVHAFYNARRRGLLSAEVQPNPGHRALVELERRWPGQLLLVTQNIDDLHERAGSTGLIHMHGELLKSRCARCDAVAECREDLSTATVCGGCGQAGGLRPHVVWFGEMPLEMERIYEALADCAMFVAIGTSGHVYPAAGFVSTARAHGARTVELNLGRSESSRLFGDSYLGPASVIVPQFVERLLELL
jgi:NAD-dependent deacetylase